jgi:hypothetical protein
MSRAFLAGRQMALFFDISPSRVPLRSCQLGDRTECYRAHPTGRRHYGGCSISFRLHVAGPASPAGYCQFKQSSGSHTRLVGFPHRDCGKTGLFFGTSRGGPGLPGAAPLPIDRGRYSGRIFRKFCEFLGIGRSGRSHWEAPAKQARQRNRRASKLSGCCLIATIGERIANLKHGFNMKSISEFGIRLVSHSRPTGRTSSVFSLRLLQCCASPTSFPLPRRPSRSA